MATKSPYRGMLVYIRKTWGTDAGQVDESRLFSVRSCGPKMAILDYVDKETKVLSPYRRRGHTIYLHSKEYVEEQQRQNAANGRGGWRNFYYWDWSQMLVPQGEAGWDPSQNF